MKITKITEFRDHMNVRYRPKNGSMGWKKARILVSVHLEYQKDKFMPLYNDDSIKDYEFEVVTKKKS